MPPKLVTHREKLLGAREAPWFGSSPPTSLIMYTQRKDAPLGSASNGTKRSVRFRRPGAYAIPEIPSNR